MSNESTGNFKQNGWNEWAKYVLKELQRLNDVDKDITTKLELNQKELVKEIKDAIKDLKEGLDEKFMDNNTNMKNLENDLTTLKIKAGIWGFVGACIPTIIAIILWVIEFHNKAPK